jgi:hypothetical protein
VITERRHAMADRLHLRRHVRLPQRIRIVEDAGVLDMLAGIDGRSRRGADARCRLMIGKGDAVFLDPLTTGNWHPPIFKEVFLVDKDEQDIVTGRR